MESSENNATCDTSWTAATNWTIAGGSLLNSITFESSLSLISDDNNDHGNHDHDQISTLDSKSPLILCSPTPDSAPCEITINFAQKHEVRQVYVRSTARVYEIYCAPELQSSSEYLCTVRCGIVARDEEVLHDTNIEEAVLAHARSSIQEPAEEKLRNGNSPSPNEDDWVEVKALDSPLAIDRNNSSSSHSGTNPERNSQDLYEATAEITDANPSTSLTLRLLSLQNKGYVCVDEVYVFGDPVDTSNLDNQTGPTENSAGNSLMAMLVPAFFQLSKTKGIGGGEDKYIIDTRERQKSQEIGSKAATPADVEKKIQEEVRLQEAVGPTSKPVQHEIPQVSNAESKPDISRNHFEGVLDQLVSRVNRIEDLFLRFEESMLKPINSIDARLQLVEQQLDVLTKRTENSALLSCTRISAPDFSCSESETNSSNNSGSRDISYMACEANKNHLSSPLTSVLPDATPVSVNDTKLQPGLVVTAPEFSNYDDDEEEDHAVESVRESTKDKQKPVMSIDDALAYALAGFLSSTSMQSNKYSQTLAIKAPDFPSEEENSNEKAAPPIVESELNMDPSTCFSESDGTQHMGNSLSLVSNVTSSDSDENVMRSFNDNNSSKMVETVDEQCQHQHSEEDEGESQDICVGLAVSPVTHDAVSANSYQNTDDIKDEEAGNGTSNFSDLQKTESRKQFSGDHTDDASVTTPEVAVSNQLVACTEGTEKESKQDILRNIVELSHASSIVDFESPILEVKFVAHENSGIKSPLEALLAGMPDLEVEVPPVMENNNDGSVNGDQYNLISVEDLRAVDSGTDTHISVDMDYYSLDEMPSSIEADKLHDCYTSSSHEMPVSSLI